MIPEWQDQLQYILNKDISSLTSSDIVFLRARQSYLTDEQRLYYDAILNYTPSENLKNKPKKENNLLLFSELKNQAKERGIFVPKGTKLEELRALLNQ